MFSKIKNLNKVVKSEDGQNVIAVYKRCTNILEQSKKDLKQEFFGDPDTVLFKHNEENFLLEKNIYKFKLFFNVIQLNTII